MKSIFDRISGAIAQRSAIYRDITHQFSLVRQDKLATVTDLFGCFEANPRFADALGPGSSRFLSAMMKNQVKPESIPSSLLKTVSRENIKQARGEFETSPENVAKVKAVYEGLNAILEKSIFTPFTPEQIEASINPTSESLYWVDDFLAATDSVIHLKRAFKLSAYLYGDGEKTLEVVNNLRNLPDYSSHFPPRPPRNGDGAKKKEDAPRVVIPGMSAPTGR